MFRPFTENDREFLEQAVARYYQEDPGYAPVPVDHTRRTVAALQAAPDMGAIWVAERDQRAIGYAITIHYWSNEFGGLLMVLDEFFVAPPHRSAGVGSAFLDFLEDAYRRRGFVAAFLS